MTVLDTLLDDIFAGRDASLAADFAAWLRGSRRFQAFATTYRGKIRAKLRHAQDEDGRRDLRAELETAALLLGEERFTLEYEKYSAAKQRGPDFTVTFKTHTPFNVEVRRIRGEWAAAGSEARAGKLMTVLGDKVGQMPPGIVNLLWLWANDDIDEADVLEATKRLRTLAERKDDAFFARRGPESAAEFLRQYARLSGIVWRQAAEMRLWPNPIARHRVPAELATAMQRLGARN